ncbi:hypothetical protein CsSME_00023285 [Camellia sinensis var. sinensis]
MQLLVAAFSRGQESEYFYASLYAGLYYESQLCGFGVCCVVVWWPLVRHGLRKEREAMMFTCLVGGVMEDEGLLGLYGCEVQP